MLLFLTGEVEIEDACRAIKAEVEKSLDTQVCMVWCGVVWCGVVWCDIATWNITWCCVVSRVYGGRLLFPFNGDGVSESTRKASRENKGAGRSASLLTDRHAPAAEQTHRVVARTAAPSYPYVVRFLFEFCSLLELLLFA